MDIKAEVRHRITELTRFAYECGFRDSAQSALTEMEAIGAEDVVEQLSKVPVALKAIAEKPAKAKAVKAKPSMISQKRKLAPPERRQPQSR